MTFKNKLIIITFLISQSVIASINKESEFNDLFAKSEISSQSESGALYDRILGAHFQKNWFGVLDNCRKQHQKFAEIKFKAIFVISKHGKIEKFILNKKNKFSLCLEKALVEQLVPIPPSGIQLNPFKWQGLK